MSWDSPNTRLVACGETALPSTAKNPVSESSRLKFGDGMPLALKVQGRRYGCEAGLTRQRTSPARFL